MLPRLIPLGWEHLMQGSEGLTGALKSSKRIEGIKRNSDYKMEELDISESKKV